MAEQIKEAIAFSLTELEEQTREHPEFAAKYDVAFNASAARLLESFFAGQPLNGFFHWDALSTITSATLAPVSAAIFSYNASTLARRAGSLPSQSF